MQPMIEKVYGIPPEQVVGSTIQTIYEVKDGKPVLLRLPKIEFIDFQISARFNASSLFHEMKRVLPSTTPST